MFLLDADHRVGQREQRPKFLRGGGEQAVGQMGLHRSLLLSPWLCKGCTTAGCTSGLRLKASTHTPASYCLYSWVLAHQACSGLLSHHVVKKLRLVCISFGTLPRRLGYLKMSSVGTGGIPCPHGHPTPSGFKVPACFIHIYLYLLHIFIYPSIYIKICFIKQL